MISWTTKHPSFQHWELNSVEQQHFKSRYRSPRQYQSLWRSQCWHLGSVHWRSDWSFRTIYMLLTFLQIPILYHITKAKQFYNSTCWGVMLAITSQRLQQVRRPISQPAFDFLYGSISRQYHLARTSTCSMKGLSLWPPITRTIWFHLWRQSSPDLSKRKHPVTVTTNQSGPMTLSFDIWKAFHSFWKNSLNEYSLLLIL